MKTKGTLVSSDLSVGRTIMSIDPPATRFFWGHGYTSLICGKCGCMLAEDVFPADIKNKLFKCNQCQSVNYVKDIK